MRNFVLQFKVVYRSLTVNHLSLTVIHLNLTVIHLSLTKIHINLTVIHLSFTIIQLRKGYQLTQKHFLSANLVNLSRSTVL